MRDLIPVGDKDLHEAVSGGKLQCDSHTHDTARSFTIMDPILLVLETSMSNRRG
jgi:hypothetical protein